MTTPSITDTLQPRRSARKAAERTVPPPEKKARKSSPPRQTKDTPPSTPNRKGKVSAVTHPEKRKASLPNNPSQKPAKTTAPSAPTDTYTDEEEDLPSIDDVIASAQCTPIRVKKTRHQAPDLPSSPSLHSDPAFAQEQDMSLDVPGELVLARKAGHGQLHYPAKLLAFLPTTGKYRLRYCDRSTSHLPRHHFASLTDPHFRSCPIGQWKVLDHISPEDRQYWSERVASIQPALLDLASTLTPDSPESASLSTTRSSHHGGYGSLNHLIILQAIRLLILPHLLASPLLRDMPRRCSHFCDTILTPEALTLFLIHDHDLPRHDAEARLLNVPSSPSPEIEDVDDVWVDIIMSARTSLEARPSPNSSIT